MKKDNSAHPGTAECSIRDQHELNARLGAGPASAELVVLRLGPGRFTLDPAALNRLAADIEIRGADIDQSHVHFQSSLSIVNHKTLLLSQLTITGDSSSRSQNGEDVPLVTVESDGGLTAEQVRFVGGGTAIRLSQGCLTRVEACQFRGQRRAIVCASDAVIRGSRFEEIAGVGVEIAAGSPTLVSNHFTQCGRQAVLIRAGTPLLRENVIERSAKNGITVRGDSAPRLEANTCRDNGMVGIVYLERSSGLAMANVAIGHQRNAGIWVGGNATVRLRKNRTRGNLVGLCVSGHAKLRVTGHEAGQNRRGGVVIEGESTVLLEKAHTFENHVDGIRVRQKARAEVRSCRSEHNQLSGISFSDHAQGLAIENVCRCNEEDGIAVGAWSNAELRGNDCRSNLRFGVHFQDAASGVCKENQFRHNGLAGLKVRGRCEVEPENNQEQPLPKIGEPERFHDWFPQYMRLLMPDRVCKPMSETELDRLRLPRFRDGSGEAPLPPSLKTILRYDMGFGVVGAALLTPVLARIDDAGKIGATDFDWVLRTSMIGPSFKDVPQDVALWNPDPKLPALVAFGHLGDQRLFMYVGEADEAGEYPMARFDDEPDFYVSDASLIHYLVKEMLGKGAAAFDLRGAKQRNAKWEAQERWADNKWTRKVLSGGSRPPDGLVH